MRRKEETASEMKVTNSLLRKIGQVGANATSSEARQLSAAVYSFFYVRYLFYVEKV